MLSCEICKTFRNNFFTEHLRWLLCIKNNHSVAHGFPPFTLTEKATTCVTAGENNIKLEKLAQTAAFYVHDSVKSSLSDVFLGKGFLKLCSKFTGKHPCQITLPHGCSAANLFHIFRAVFKNTYGGLLLVQVKKYITFTNKWFFI